MAARARRWLKPLLFPVGQEEARGILPHFGPETIQIPSELTQFADHRRKLRVCAAREIVDRPTIIFDKLAEARPDFSIV